MPRKIYASDEAVTIHLSKLTGARLKEMAGASGYSSRQLAETAINAMYRKWISRRETPQKGNENDR
jgi:predicted transcriptional regulator